jgi:hypothetical protein
MIELVGGSDILVMRPDLEQTNRQESGAKQQTRRLLPQPRDERLEPASPFTTNSAVREATHMVVQANASSNERPTDERRHGALTFQ